MVGYTELPLVRWRQSEPGQRTAAQISVENSHSLLQFKNRSPQMASAGKWARVCPAARIRFAFIGFCLARSGIGFRVQNHQRYKLFFDGFPYEQIRCVRRLRARSRSSAHRSAAPGRSSGRRSARRRARRRTRTRPTIDQTQTRRTRPVQIEKLADRSSRCRPQIEACRPRPRRRRRSLRQNRPLPPRIPRIIQ